MKKKIFQILTICLSLCTLSCFENNPSGTDASDIDPPSINSLSAVVEDSILASLLLQGKNFRNGLDISLDGKNIDVNNITDTSLLILLKDQLAEGTHTIVIKGNGFSASISFYVIQNESDIAITWKGMLNNPPSDPELNWVYQDTIQDIAYLWNGSEWLIIVADLESVLERILDTIPPEAPQVLSPDTSYSLPTWSWNLPDDAVEFRYQINGEKEDAWILVKDSIRTYTPPENLPEGIHTLYVQCRDKEGNWSSSGSASVVVLYWYPLVIKHPAELAVNLSHPDRPLQPTKGDTVSLSIEAIGNNLSYQWWIDTTKVENATEATYVIYGITAADSGKEIYCIISNNLGSDTSQSVRLTVVTTIAPLQELLIVRKPALSLSLLEGAACTLSVAATGGTITYQWLKNGVEIPNANDTMYIISKILPNDSNVINYQCRISNEFFSTLTSTKIKIISRSPKIISHIEDQCFCATRSATFLVSVQGDDITYQWYRNNEKIANATSSQYQISEASMDDSGDVFFCVVQNSFGSDTSNPAMLHVYAPNAPQVTAPGDYSIVWTWNLPKDAIEFRYQLDSTNNDKWTTVKKTVRSYTLPKNVSGTHTLFVQCRGEIGGWSYTGSATATIDPAIFAPPIITVQPTYQIIENGKIVMFTIEAKGLDLCYEWKRDTETISRDLIFYWGNERSATGFYKCIVSNEYGSVISDSVFLQVKEKGLIDDFFDGNAINEYGFEWSYYEDNDGLGDGDRPQADPSTTPSVINVDYTEKPRHAFGNMDDLWPVKEYVFSVKKEFADNWYGTMPFTYGEKYKAPWGEGDPYVAITSRLSSGSPYVDFSTVSQIEFKMRSHGELVVTFKIETQDIVDDSSNAFYQADFYTAPFEWMHYSISLNDLKQPAWTPTSSKRAFDKTKVCGLTWEVYGGQNNLISSDTLDIDDIRFK